MRFVARMAQIGLLPILVLTAGAASAGASIRVGVGRGEPARLSADLACLPDGGAEVTFTIRNPGRRTLTIDEDFHLFLDTVGRDGREFAGAVAVFPIPELAEIRPGGESTFRVPIGDAVEEEPGTDLRARRLILGAEVFFEGRNQAVSKHFSFPGCDAPTPSRG